jgi:hypothetical protein
MAMSCSPRQLNQESSDQQDSKQKADDEAFIQKFK